MKLIYEQNDWEYKTPQQTLAEMMQQAGLQNAIMQQQMQEQERQTLIALITQTVKWQPLHNLRRAFNTLQQPQLPPQFNYPNIGQPYNPFNDPFNTAGQWPQGNVSLGMQQQSALSRLTQGFAQANLPQSTIDKWSKVEKTYNEVFNVSHPTFI